jgi:hypothetical protein
LNMSDPSPFGDERILSGGIRIKDENLLFRIWGFRKATREEIMISYRLWLSQYGRTKKKRKNKIIDVMWNG